MLNERYPDTMSTMNAPLSCENQFRNAFENELRKQDQSLLLCGFRSIFSLLMTSSFNRERKRTTVIMEDRNRERKENEREREGGER